MNGMKSRVLGCVLGLVIGSQAQAAVTLMDANEWKIMMGGFVETDMMMDTTRSFNEAPGNGPVAKPGTLDGENGRVAFSNRNSRLSFTILPPVQDEWKSKGYFEFDFLGYEPTIASGGISEAGFYSNPTLRIRHAYLNAEKNGWTFLVGQAWSLFGWQPAYVPSIISVSPGPGIVYQRTLQASAIKSFGVGENGTMQAGLAMARPTQRDSNMPNFDVGVRYAMNSRRSGFASSSSDAKAEPMSLGLSGTFRQFSTADENNVRGQMNKTNGSAVAADLFLPIIASNEKETANTLTLTAEYTTGTGYGDQLSGWTGGTSALSGSTGFMASGGSKSGYTNLDAGIGVYNSTTGNFELIKLQTMSAQLQYHFGAESKMFSTLGYSQVSSNNVEDLGGTYDKSDMSFINLFKDLTSQIRVGAGFETIKTSYTKNATGTGAVSPVNNRYQISAFFRF